MNKININVFLVIFLSDFIICTIGYNANDVLKVDNHPNWKYADREECGETLADRIIGGKEATLGQYPWLAQVGYTIMFVKPNIQFNCGASLITKCWVLTAAHCVDNLPSNIFVSGIRLGEHDTTKEIDCDDTQCADRTQDFAPKRILVHKDYGEPKFKNDISLIQLDRPIIVTKWVTPICLPYSNLLEKDLIDKIAEVAGWGITNVRTSETSTILQTVKLPIVKNEKCHQVYKKKANIDNRQLCVGGVIGYDSCGGDSGGPLMMVDFVTVPKYYIFGVVSFGSKNCGNKTAPGVYTKVTQYMKWILDNITPC